MTRRTLWIIGGLLLIDAPLIVAMLIVSVRYGLEDSVRAGWEWRTGHMEAYAGYLTLMLLLARARRKAVSS